MNAMCVEPKTYARTKDIGIICKKKIIRAMEITPLLLHPPWLTLTVAEAASRAALGSYSLLVKCLGAALG